MHKIYFTRFHVVVPSIQNAAISLDHVPSVLAIAIIIAMHGI